MQKKKKNNHFIFCQKWKMSFSDKQEKYNEFLVYA